MKIYYLLLLLITAVPAMAQNLIPNPSFEDYETCPMYFDGMEIATFGPSAVEEWSRPSAATSDYFNSCSTGSVSVPANLVGYQYARTGDAYAGFITLYKDMFGSEEADWNDWREYIQVALSSTLTAGHHYYMSYWVSLSGGQGEYAIATDRMGAYFSDTLVHESMILGPLDFFIPQVESPAGYTFMDTAGWMHVGGEFTATGTENAVLIGNFAPAAEIIVDTAGLNEGDYFVYSSMAYYFCDDVCLVDLDDPIAHATYDTSFCQHDSLVLKGRDPGTAYIWSDGSTAATKTIFLQGTYWVRTVDVNNCQAFIDTFVVSGSLVHIPLNLGNDTIVCEGAPLLLNADNGIFNNFNWSTGDTSPSITVNAAGIYYVTAASDCKTGTDTIIITTPAEPEIILPEDMFLCEGTPVFLGGREEGISYLWNTGSTECCISITETGTYRLVAANICGDTVMDEIKVDFSDCDYCILAPNAFSPNGDGKNDRFLIQVNCPMQVYKFQVFNRWGQVVFSSAKTNDAWDGTVNGKPADVGTYFYRVEGTPLMKQVGKITRKGDITLIR